MDDAAPRPKLPSRWAGVAATLPPSLDLLRGPSGGVVELPADLAPAGDTTFDLDDPAQRYLYHMTVLTSAVSSEQCTRWLNRDLLLSDWNLLRLPGGLRSAWAERFQELGRE
jgi:hypothetical protein